MTKQQELQKMYYDLWRTNYIEDQDYVEWLKNPIYKAAVERVKASPLWQHELGLWRETTREYELNNEKHIYHVHDIRVKVSENGSYLHVYRHNPYSQNEGRDYDYVGARIHNGYKTLQCFRSRSFNSGKLPFKGLGRELYQEMIEQARQLGLQYKSDSSLSSYGEKAYYKLREEGYQVETKEGNRTPVYVTPSKPYYKRVSPTNFKYQCAIIHELKAMHEETSKVFAFHAMPLTSIEDVRQELMAFLETSELKFAEKERDWNTTKDLYKKIREKEQALLTPPVKKHLLKRKPKKKKTT